MSGKSIIITLGLMSILIGKTIESGLFLDLLSEEDFVDRK
jgi:hypothetical protein